MESIKKRNKLVDELIEVIKQEWKKVKLNFISECCIIFDCNGFTLGDMNNQINDDVLKVISAKSTALAWVKSEIIDNNGIIFRRYHMADNNTGQAVFWVDTETIKILIHNKDFVIRILNKAEKGVMNHMHFNFLNYAEDNISDSIISIPERVMYQEKKWEK